MAVKKEPAASAPRHRPDRLFICLWDTSWSTTQGWLLSLATSRNNSASVWYLNSVCVESQTKGDMETLLTITMNLDQKQKWQMSRYTGTESLQGRTALARQPTTPLLLFLTTCYQIDMHGDTKAHASLNHRSFPLFVLSSPVKWWGLWLLLLLFLLDL